MKRVLFCLLTFIMFFSIVNAKTGGNETTPKEIFNSDNQSDYYENYDVLNITKEDIEYLDKIDFSQFKILQEMRINDEYFSDFDKIGTTNTVVDLVASNSVLDLSKFKGDVFTHIDLSNSYVLRKADSSIDISYDNVVNADNLVIQDKYQETINNMAKEIYEKSDKTPEGIIKEVTIFVVDYLEYKTPGEIDIQEAIFEKQIGVCAHYAFLESVLLNKLGIFAINVTGWTDNNDKSGTTHAWTRLFYDGHWYSMDATWLDDEGWHETLENYPNSLSWYMKPIDDETFNNSHYSYFDNDELIPLKYRVSQTSILEQLKDEEKATDEDDIEEKELVDNPKEKKKDEVKKEEKEEKDNDSKMIAIIIGAVVVAIMVIICGVIVFKLIKKRKIERGSGV